MSFSLVAISHGTSEIKPGQCAVQKSGRIMLHVADASAAKPPIGKRVVTLADRATGRIAIRAARADDPEIAGRAVDWNKDETRCQVSAAVAIREAGVDLETAVGRRRVEIKGDLIIILLEVRG